MEKVDSNGTCCWKTMTPVGTAGALEPMGSGKLEVIIECKFYKLNFLGNRSECWAYLIRGTGKAWA